MGSNWSAPDEYIVDGYLGGAKVFSDVFGAPVGPAGTAEASIAGGRRSFDRIVFSARNGIQVGLDDLDFTCN